MKTLLVVVSLSSWAIGGEISTTEWLEQNAVPKTTETRDFSSSGEVQSVTIVREFSVQIKQTSVEILKRDETGSLTAASHTRQTETVDAHGGKTTVKEEDVGLSGLAVVEETETFKSGNVTEVSTRKRSKNGLLVLSQRVTQTVQDNGTVVTVTESLAEDGRLVVRKVATQN